MNATAALPIEGASIREQCRAKIRAMLAPYSGAARRVDPGEALWTLLTDSERRFLCRVAKLDGGLAALAWRELPEGERAEIVTAWERLADWVGRVSLHLDAVRRRGS